MHALEYCPKENCGKRIKAATVEVRTYEYSLDCKKLMAQAIGMTAGVFVGGMAGKIFVDVLNLMYNPENGV